MQPANETPAQATASEVKAPIATAQARKWLDLRGRGLKVIFIVALLLYSVLSGLANRYAYFAWDIALARWIQSISVPGFYPLMRWISVPGTGITGFVLVVLAGLAMLVAKWRVEAAVCCIGAGLGSLLDTLLKELSDRPRPTSSLVQVLGHFTSESFPSGHVFFYVEFFGFLWFLSWVHLRPNPLRMILLICLSLLIASIGLSRVYLGAHWPSDVAGAYLGGGIWLWLMIAVYRRLRT